MEAVGHPRPLAWAVDLHNDDYARMSCIETLNDSDLRDLHYHND